MKKKKTSWVRVIPAIILERFARTFSPSTIFFYFLKSEFNYNSYIQQQYITFSFKRHKRQNQ